MPNSDQLQRFLFDGSPIRGELVQLSSAYQSALANNQYPEQIRSLLGQFLSAVTLLSATVKFNGTLILQAKDLDNGSVFMAECNNRQYIRAVARISEDLELTENVAASTLMKRAQLVITIDPDVGERYQGIVNMTDANLAAALEGYFLQSEQLKTRIWLAANTNETAGLLLQALPESAHESSLTKENEYWDHVIALSDTIKDEELLALTQQEILYRLFHEEKVQLFTPESIEFRCGCSKQKSIAALQTLGKEEVMSIFEEQGGIDIDCQFCGENFLFEPHDIEIIFPLSLH